MSAIVESSSPRRPREHRESASRLPGGLLPSRENDPLVEARGEIGRGIQRALALLGWTADRLCKELEVRGGKPRDHRQVGRWLSGEERPQVDTVWTVKEIRRELAIALAELADCDVETVIRAPRRRL